MAYEYLDNPAPVGGRIKFRRRELDDNPADYVRPDKLASMGVAFAYIDGGTMNEVEALNSLGRQLQTDNPPYDPRPARGTSGWIRFMDDLETMSFREAGLVIVVDNAAQLFADPRSWAFELVEMWVLQLKGWQRRELPCHLVFQMETDPAVAATYDINANGS